MVTGGGKVPWIHHREDVDSFQNSAKQAKGTKPLVGFRIFDRNNVKFKLLFHGPKWLSKRRLPAYLKITPNRKGQSFDPNDSISSGSISWGAPPLWKKGLIKGIRNGQ